MKKHEVIEADIRVYAGRIEMLSQIIQDLEKENYYNWQDHKKRYSLLCYR